MSLYEKIKKNPDSFCEWLIMDLLIAFLPIIIKLLFSSISGLVDIYSELFFVALLLSAGTLKYLYKLKKSENVGDPVFWLSIFVLILAAIAYGILTVLPPKNVATGNYILPTLIIADLSSVIMSLNVWYKSIG